MVQEILVFVLSVVVVFTEGQLDTLFVSWYSFSLVKHKNMDEDRG